MRIDCQKCGAVIPDHCITTRAHAFLNRLQITVRCHGATYSFTVLKSVIQERGVPDGAVVFGTAERGHLRGRHFERGARLRWGNFERAI